VETHLEFIKCPERKMDETFLILMFGKTALDQAEAGKNGQ
jgi:hypothetical protein